MTGIVDTHVHLWDPRILRYGWLDDLPLLNRPFLPNDFSAASSGKGVTKMVFVECGREPYQALDEVDWVSRLAETVTSLCGIVAHAPLEKGEAVRDDLNKLAKRPLVKGVRRLLQGESDASFCLRAEFVAGVRMLADHEFTFDLCIRHEQLPAVTELVKRVPDVRFILDHFGKPPLKAGAVEPWAADLKALALQPNVSCKISGLTTEADWQGWTVEQLRPYFEIALEAFGSDRVLFGGDWPVSTLATSYGRWLDVVSELSENIQGVDQTKLFRTNGEKFYGL